MCAGCSGIAWNVSAGLSDTFGARFVLNIWFPGNTSSLAGGSESSQAEVRRVRHLLLPNGTAPGTAGAAAALAAAHRATAVAADQDAAAAAAVDVVPLSEVEAILVLSYRRFFATISSRDDYRCVITDRSHTHHSSISLHGTANLSTRVSSTVPCCMLPCVRCAHKRPTLLHSRCLCYYISYGVI